VVEGYESEEQRAERLEREAAELAVAHRRRAAEISVRCEEATRLARARLSETPHDCMIEVLRRKGLRDKIVIKRVVPGWFLGLEHEPTDPYFDSSSALALSETGEVFVGHMDYARRAFRTWKEAANSTRVLDVLERVGR
jgi:hypothetical protein